MSSERGAAGLPGGALLGAAGCDALLDATAVDGPALDVDGGWASCVTVVGSNTGRCGGHLLSLELRCVAPACPRLAQAHPPGLREGVRAIPSNEPQQSASPVWGLKSQISFRFTSQNPKQWQQQLDS